MSFQFLGTIDEIDSNISYFPLYDRLVEKVKRDEFVESTTLSSSLPIATLTKIVDEIRDLDKENSDLIFVLIRVHSLREGQDNVFSLPYEAKKGMGEDEFDIEFDLKNLPFTLQCILYQFVKASSTCHSPKRDLSSNRSQKSFLKRPLKSTETTFVLRKINPASLDKQHNLKEVVECGTKNKTIVKPFANKFTKIDSIGLAKEDELDKPFIIQGSHNQKISCCYCTLPVPATNEVINVKMYKFCSYNCALALSNVCPITCPKTQVQEQITALFGNKKCNPSPPYFLLDKFGGSLSPRSYRKEMQQKNFMAVPMIQL